MKRLQVAIIIGDKPNYDENAFKYFILYLNKIQTTYEFRFPDLTSYPFQKEVCNFENSILIFNDFLKKKEIQADFSIAIITSRFDNNYFFNAKEETAIISINKWDKYFSPPSLFEYLLHCIYSCLIYSQKAPVGRSIPETAKGIVIDSHRDTFGCVIDFTRDKFDDRVDITLGYICDNHKEEIMTVFGEQYLNETINILERKWIGNLEEKDSVAYNLNHIFKFNINKDSGFNKNLWDKCKESFYAIPGNLTGEVLKLVLTVVITYLLVKYGLSTNTGSR